jgi:hypothetical protein
MCIAEKVFIHQAICNTRDIDSGSYRLDSIDRCLDVIYGDFGLGIRTELMVCIDGIGTDEEVVQKALHGSGGTGVVKYGEADKYEYDHAGSETDDKPTVRPGTARRWTKLRVGREGIRRILLHRCLP